MDSSKIFYREAGPKDSPTILLLHGFPTSSHMFRNLIPALAGRYHVVAPDLPGFCFSDAVYRAAREMTSRLESLVGKTHPAHLLSGRTSLVSVGLSATRKLSRNGVRGDQEGCPRTGLLARFAPTWPMSTLHLLAAVGALLILKAWTTDEPVEEATCHLPANTYFHWGCFIHSG